jgi:hypothetical protein
MNPFDYVTSINYTKQDIMNDDQDEKAYPAFMVNRSLSYFADTVGLANVMNRYHHLDSKLQYHFLINIVRKRKRFSKWVQVLSLLSPEQLTIIKQKVSKGGRTSNR